MICEIDERRCADGDEDIGSQAGTSLAILPFGPDQRSEHKGGHETDQGVEKIVKLKRLNEPHCLLDQDQAMPERTWQADLEVNIAARKRAINDIDA